VVNDLPAELRGGMEGATLAVAPAAVVRSAPQTRTMEEIEREAILETLRRTGGRRAEAAQLLGIGLRTLQRKLKDYKVQGHSAE
jgi:DNA-binding NtrC family response regulator